MTTRNQNSATLENNFEEILESMKEIIRESMKELQNSMNESFKQVMKKFSDLRASNERGLEVISEMKTSSLDREALKAAVYENEGNDDAYKVFDERSTIGTVTRKVLISGSNQDEDCLCVTITQYQPMYDDSGGRKESVLLCGTSGCGQSILSALLSSRLGITAVISTDSIRHMMRSSVDEKENPLFWASTYHAGEYLDPVAVAEANTKRKVKKLTSLSTLSKGEVSDGSINGTTLPEEGSNTVGLISPKQMAIEGYKAQSEMVIDGLDRLITEWKERKESVVDEGVHLSLNFVMGFMKKHPSIIPFLIYITNGDKHLERFAFRAKYMTLDPEKNKYVKYIRNIRTIQGYLCNRADKLAPYY